MRESPTRIQNEGGFTYKLDVEEFLDWIKNVQLFFFFFEYMNTPEDKKVKLVTLKLQLRVSAWWDQTED